MPTNYITNDTELTAVADAIRQKGGTSAPLSFPSGFAQAIGNISTGITPTGTISINQNGQFDVSSFAIADVDVGDGIIDYVWIYQTPGNTSNRLKMPTIPNQAGASVVYNVNFESNGEIFSKIRVRRGTGTAWTKFYVDYYNSDGYKNIYYEDSKGHLVKSKYRRMRFLGGDDAENNELVGVLVNISSWQEPSSYDADTMYLYVNIPYDNFFVHLYLLGGSGNTGNWGDSSNNQSFTSIFKNEHYFEFSGKYIISLTSASKLIQKEKYSGSDYYSIFGAPQVGIILKKIRFPENGSLFQNTDTGYGKDGEYCYSSCYELEYIYNINEFGTAEFRYSAIKEASINATHYDTIKSGAFLDCYNLRKVTIPSGIVAMDGIVFENDYNLGEVRIEAITPPTITNASCFTGVSTACKYYIPYSALADYAAIPTNYPQPTSYSYYIGFSTYESGVTLPTQDTTEAYNVVWYATKADAIAQANPITVGNGSEIYCRYTAV